jgi:hypothetical protein
MGALSSRDHPYCAGLADSTTAGARYSTIALPGPEDGRGAMGEYIIRRLLDVTEAKEGPAGLDLSGGDPRGIGLMR